MYTVVFPGQGAQRKGMGAGLFEAFPEITQAADELLGLSVRTLCLDDPHNQLNLTQFTQPALYTVNALHYLDFMQNNGPAGAMAGHSLGEYNALQAAGAFDFATGLQLVQERGRLMSQATAGGMLAVLQCDEQRLRELLAAEGLDSVDLANHNTPTQCVLSAERSAIEAAYALLKSQGITAIPLKVSGAFHSRHMRDAATAFGHFLRTFTFKPLNATVLANVTAQPYTHSELAALLEQQLCGQVRWVDCVRRLMGLGASTLHEVGPGQVLTGLNKEIMQHCDPLPCSVPSAAQSAKRTDAAAQEIHDVPPAQSPQMPESAFGSLEFMRDHGLRHPCVAGSMGRGISGVPLVTALAQAGLLGFIGSFDVPVQHVAGMIDDCKARLGGAQNFGVNVHDCAENSSKSADLLSLCSEKSVPCVELSGFDRVTSALVKHRALGLSEHDGLISRGHKVLLKTSRAEVARQFMQAAPARLLDELLETQQITSQQHRLAQQCPVADDVCVTCDGAWVNEPASAWIKLPEFQQLRASLGLVAQSVRLGCSGGIGTPQSMAAAFQLGADFVLTGSINQCTVEAGVHEAVKAALAQAGVEDTAFAPRADALRSDVRSRVLCGVSHFATRARHVLQLMHKGLSLQSVGEDTRAGLEQHFFGQALETVLKTACESLPDAAQQQVRSDGHRQWMLVLQQYLRRAERAVLSDQDGDLRNARIDCSAAMGAFNAWAKGTPWQDWRARQVAPMTLALLRQCAEMLDGPVVGSAAHGG